MSRINKCIDLLKQGLPIIEIGLSPGDFRGNALLTYEEGQKMSQTWADLIIVDFEHYPFNVQGLADFMRGLTDGGPTESGHLTPTVIVTLPSNAISAEEVRYNAWQVRHVLSTGIHGILHTHVRNAAAAREFVASTRYPFQTLGLKEGIPEGLRGSGGQHYPANLWNMSGKEYTEKADPWPLNPDGELMLGVKIEDRYCLENAEDIAATPGLIFGEWGPGDMGMSFGLADAHDPPYPQEMLDAYNRVKSAYIKENMAFLSSWGKSSEDDNYSIESSEEGLLYITKEIGSQILRPKTKEQAEFIRKNATYPKRG